MSSHLRGKWIAITIVVLGCLFGIIGLPRSTRELAANLNHRIRLGLDLKGGSHMALQVQLQDAFMAEADQTIEQLKPALTKASVTFGSIDRNAPRSIETAASIQIDIRGASQPADLRRVVADVAGSRWALTSVSASDYRLTLRPEAAIELRRATLDGTIETIEKKINGLGVAEASVQRRGGTDGEAEILVQLPGVDDPARVRTILQTTAMLELCEVKGGPYNSEAALLAAHGGVLPLGSRIAHGAHEWWLLARSPVVTGRDLRDARPQQAPDGTGWETAFVLTQDAAGRFERFTSANIGNRLAIVLDSTVISAPRIDGAIRDQGRIMGAASHEDAADLALNLRAGALPAGVKVIEERIVGPSLGADSIRRGLVSGLLGLALVVASMVAYYRGAGWNAVIALALNTIITVAGLSYIGATWTLPGIAGLILSIGMAVDSNVLIFERIKEEMRAGKAVPLAISAGFSRAFTTIIDTHVTTVVASAFLFVFGTGPVRGFAVTLVIGLLANLFTAVFVSRALFDWLVERHPRLTRLSIWPRGADRDLFPTTHIGFLNRPTLTLALSALLVVASLVTLAVNGGLKYGLDFRGGTLTYVRFSPAPPIDQLRALLTSRLGGEISVQETKGTGEFIIGTALADEHKLEQARASITAALREKYAPVGNRLDLNNATQADLEAALRAAPLSDQQIRESASAVLQYRDHTRGGLITNLDELRAVAPAAVATIKDTCGLASYNIRSVEMVGPRAGEQLRRQALLATIGALGGMLIYVAFRFRLVSGLAAVIATVHDVVITLGLFSLAGREIDLNIIAALLTLIGYSMNDTIVVFDRVRENLSNPANRRLGILTLVNQAVNQTLSRTVLTAGPMLLACLALYFLGGAVLNGIAFTLLVGIVVGTYSSIFVASALLVWWHSRGVQPAAPTDLAKVELA
jgi:preprotein translocase subunit SecD